MMLSEGVNTKFKAEFKTPEISPTENLPRECKPPNSQEQTWAPSTVPRAKTDKLLHSENPTTFKTEELLDQTIMMSKIAEVEATTKIETTE